MPVTEPKDISDVGRNGDTEETAITNDPANEGFPARTQGGDLVFITDKRYQDGVLVLTANDGSEYVDDKVLGFLVPYSSEELGDVEAHVVDVAETPEEVQDAAVEDSQPLDGGDDLVDAA